MKTEKEDTNKATTQENYALLLKISTKTQKPKSNKSTASSMILFSSFPATAKYKQPKTNPIIKKIWLISAHMIFQLGTNSTFNKIRSKDIVKIQSSPNITANSIEAKNNSPKVNSKKLLLEY